MNLKEIRKGIIKQYLQNINLKDDIFKTLNQEIENRLDDDYINRMSTNPNFKQDNHEVVLEFLFELADSVDNRINNNQDDREYKLEYKGEWKWYQLNKN